MCWQRPLAPTAYADSRISFCSAQFKVCRGDITEQKEQSSLHTSYNCCGETNAGGREAVREMNLAHLFQPYQGQQNCSVGYSLNPFAACNMTTELKDFPCSHESQLPSLLNQLFFWGAWRIISDLKSQSLLCITGTPLFPSYFVHLRMLLLSWTAASSNFPSTEVAVPILPSSHGNIILQNKVQNNPMIRNLN